MPSMVRKRGAWIASAALAALALPLLGVALHSPRNVAPDPMPGAVPASSADAPATRASAPVLQVWPLQDPARAARVGALVTTGQGGGEGTLAWVPDLAARNATLFVTRPAGLLDAALAPGGGAPTLLLRDAPGTVRWETLAGGNGSAREGTLRLAGAKDKLDDRVRLAFGPEGEEVIGFSSQAPDQAAEGAFLAWRAGPDAAWRAVPIEQGAMLRDWALVGHTLHLLLTGVQGASYAALDVRDGSLAVLPETVQGPYGLALRIAADDAGRVLVAIAEPNEEDAATDAGVASPVPAGVRVATRDASGWSVVATGHPMRGSHFDLRAGPTPRLLVYDAREPDPERRLVAYAPGARESDAWVEEGRYPDAPARPLFVPGTPYLLLPTPGLPAPDAPWYGLATPPQPGFDILTAPAVSTQRLSCDPGTRDACGGGLARLLSGAARCCSAWPMGASSASQAGFSCPASPSWPWAR